MTEKQIDLFTWDFFKRITKIQSSYLEKQAEHFANLNNISKNQAFAQMDKIIKETTDDINKTTTQNAIDLQKGLQNLGYTSYTNARELYIYTNAVQTAFEENKALQHIIKAQTEVTVQSMFNMSQTTAKSLTYKNELDVALSKLNLGADNYTKAIRTIIKSQANTGLSFVDYESGYKKRLDSAVRQNVLWGMREVNQKISNFIGDEVGADGREVSVHNNPRPSHIEVQGKIYALGKARKVGNTYYPSFSNAEKLLGEYGCLHFAFPVILGVSQATYTKKELENQKRLDAEIIEGKTRYEWSQMQRNLETQVRKQKDIANMAKKMNDDILRREAQSKINQYTNSYNKISKISGIEPNYKRMEVAGFRAVKE